MLCPHCSKQYKVYGWLVRHCRTVHKKAMTKDVSAFKDKPGDFRAMISNDDVERGLKEIEILKNQLQISKTDFIKLQNIHNYEMSRYEAKNKLLKELLKEAYREIPVDTKGN